MPTVAVIGASSFSGQDFIDLLMRQTDYTVVGFGRSEERPPWNRGVKPNRYYWFDMNRNHGHLCAELDDWKPEYVVNFAALSEVAQSWDSPEDWYQTNCVALAKLVNHLRKQTYLKKYVHISSPEIYGSAGGVPLKEDAPFNPSTPYAASKAAADMLLNCYHRQFDFPVVTVRATNVMGPRQQLWKLIAKTIVTIKKGGKLQLHGGGKAVKSYIHVRDVSRGELAVMERGRVGEVYHLSPDRGVKVVDAVELIAKLMGKNLVDVAEVVAERPGQDAAYVISSEKARTELGWKPEICFRDTVAETIKWVEANWDAIKDQPLEYVHRA